MLFKKTNYYLEDIENQNVANPRKFLKPTKDEIANLKITDMVRLIFIMEKVLKNGCRAERMWVEITKIDRDDFYGILTNQPCYIKGLNIGDTINFHTSNIATVLLKEKPTFNEDYFAIITKRALESEEINWLIRTNDLHDEKDSGW